ncbi:MULTISPECIES: SGNH/GDSL hydrolase family protein [Thermomonosporaceae]|uniref:SGNH/GDSL hydrolase family protein n=1 Tax=Thermomonosporaceae TaxID=2012 RepID=UPI00255AFAF9|nr:MULTISPECIES: SGNH/GDSL hydrolase family protein [Thermomonosporaceae]MDL4772071.1 SGNH/GDSL hydrolase family protein [Actinomadura xylanilytica]
MAWKRYAAIGDSFTEGLGDPRPGGGWRGWADRVAAELAARTDGFAYANLAVRGRLLDQVLQEQLPAALDLKPDLVSVSGGGNDLLRPGTDVDDLAGRMDAAVAGLRAAGADVVLFTGVDPVGSAVIRRTRGRVAVYNEQLRAIAVRRGAHVVDQWSMDVLRDWRMWGVDRLHMSPDGHRRVALATLESLGVADAGDWREPGLEPLPELGRGARMLFDLRWARAHLAPWVARRVRGRSSGDTVTAKRPTLAPPD